MVGLPPSLREPLELSAGGGESLPDVHLYDPWEDVPTSFEPPPEVRGHSGYLADPAMSGWIDALAELLSSAPPPPRFKQT